MVQVMIEEVLKAKVDPEFYIAMQERLDLQCFIVNIVLIILLHPLHAWKKNFQGSQTLPSPSTWDMKGKDESQLIARSYAMENSFNFPTPNNRKVACFERKWIALLRNISGWCNALTMFFDHSPFDSEEYGCLRFQ